MVDTWKEKCRHVNLNKEINEYMETRQILRKNIRFCKQNAVFLLITQNNAVWPKRWKNKIYEIKERNEMMKSLISES
jgi:zona occludens toxin (predicted ATPase)